MKENEKKYTGVDFASYHAGTMPVGERQALEKAALEDPFLDDALDGYLHDTSYAANIQELQRRLARKKKKKTIALFSALRENKWWRMAAMFIIIAGVGYFFYQVNNFNNNKPLAKTENDVALPEYKSGAGEAANANTVNDSAFANQEASPAEQRQKYNLSLNKTSLAKVAADSLKEEGYLAQIPLKKSAAKSHPDTPPIALLQNETAEKGLKAPALSERIVTVKDKAPASKKLPAYAHSQTADERLTEDAGPEIKDSDFTVAVPGAKGAPESRRSKIDTQALAAIPKTKQDLEEVKVQGYGTLKRESLTTKDLAGKAAGIQIGAANLPPARVPEKFRQYLKKNIQPLYDENQQRLTGEVVLSFSIADNGRPANIKVVQSSCVPCEEHAIKLLQDGPAWAGAKGEQEKVVINF